MSNIHQTSIMAAFLASLLATPSWAEGTAQPSAPLSDAESVEQQQPATAPAPSDMTLEPPTLESDSALQLGSDPIQPLHGDREVLALTPQELTTMEVIDPAGNKLGKVDAIVRSREEQNIQAVISSGGILGIGAKEVTVPIDELQLKEDKLQISASQEELKNRQAYRPDAFVDLAPADQPISEFSAFEVAPEQPAQ